MSVIAWDGKSLVADCRGINGNAATTVRKIFRGPNGCLFGYCGTLSLGEEMRKWWLNGALPEKFPPANRDEKSYCGLIVVLISGTVCRYEMTPYPVILLDRILAWGSGADFALAAMHCGKSAEEAVRIACLYDINCGNGVDVLNLGSPSADRTTGDT